MVRNGNLEEVLPERESRKEIKDYRQFTKEEFITPGSDASNGLRYGRSKSRPKRPLPLRKRYEVQELSW